MVFQKGEINNPRGNPNIGQISKEKSTGPRTIEGKLRATLHGMKDGAHSKFLKKIKNCRFCPLGLTVKEMDVDGKIKKITVPPVCKHYMLNDKGECYYPIDQYVNELKDFME